MGYHVIIPKVYLLQYDHTAHFVLVLLIISITVSLLYTNTSAVVSRVTRDVPNWFLINLVRRDGEVPPLLLRAVGFQRQQRTDHLMSYATIISPLPQADPMQERPKRLRFTSTRKRRLLVAGAVVRATQRAAIIPNRVVFGRDTTVGPVGRT